MAIPKYSHARPTIMRGSTTTLKSAIGTCPCGAVATMAALPLVNQARIPFFGPFTGAEVLRDPFSKWVFHLRASYYDETGLIVKQLTSLGLKKIAVFYQNDAYGKAGLDGVVRALKPLGLEPAGMGTVERNTVDVDAAVKSIMAGKPDAIVQISAYKSCAAFIREARKAGYGGSFYNVSFVGTKALADELGADARGVVVSQVLGGAGGVRVGPLHRPRGQPQLVELHPPRLVEGEERAGGEAPVLAREELRRVRLEDLQPAGRPLGDTDLAARCRRLGCTATRSAPSCSARRWR